MEACLPDICPRDAYSKSRTQSFIPCHDHNQVYRTLHITKYMRGLGSPRVYEPSGSWCRPWGLLMLGPDLPPASHFPSLTAMSEVTSLHEDDWRSRPSRGPALTPIRDEEWSHHSPRSSRRWEQEPPMERPGSGWGAGRPRARSVDALDDLTRPNSAESGRRSPPSSGRRGRAYAPPRSRSRDDLYDQDDSRHFPQSRDPHYDDFRSRDRPQADPRARYNRSRDPRDDGSRSRDPEYDGRLLEEALRRKGPVERRRPYRDEEEEEEACFPPAPPPYSETDSQASRERRLKKVSDSPSWL